MKRAAYFIAVEADRAAVARVAGGSVRLEHTEPAVGDRIAAEELADAVRAKLDDFGYDGRGVCLGLSSREVLAAPIDCENLPRRDRASAMAFRLEECLPLDAEDLAVGFLRPAGGRALGAAVEAAPVAELIERLADRGVETASISSTALLALWHVTGEGEGGEFVVLASPDHVDVFRMADCEPTTWHTTSRDATEVVRAIEVDLLTQRVAGDAPTVALVGDTNEALQHAIAERTAATVVAREDPVPDLAARAAACLLDGTGAGWVDLRTGPLAPADRWGRLARPIRTAVALIVLSLAVLSAAAHWRAGRYDALAAGYEDRQVIAYHQLYPNAAAPVNPRSRLASDARRAAGVSGAHGALPEGPCALDALRQVLASLPEDVRFRLYDLRITPTDVQLDGQARGHADAERLALALRDGAGCAMEPPRTEADAKGTVTFVLMGKPREAPVPGGPTPEEGRP